MKLKQKTRHRLKMVPPQVKLTDAEILADLVYPAPLFDRDDAGHDEYERNPAH